MTLGSDAGAIVAAGIRAVEPGAAVRRALANPGRCFPAARGRALEPGTVHVVAIGKAAAPMYDAAAESLGPAFGGGTAVIHRDYRPPRFPATVVEGEHPVPGVGSFAAGRRVLEEVGRLKRPARVVFLLSGGGSAICEAPADGVAPRDLSRSTEVLLASGAPIQAMNVVRRHSSAVKGGRLRAACGTIEAITLAMSDVVGDRPCDIASGPTVADPTSYRDALAVVRRFQLDGRLPPSVVQHLRRHADERPRRGPAASEFRIIASNRLALGAAEREAVRRGYRTQVLASDVTGETREVAGVHASILRERALHGPRGRWGFLSGGETTVTLPPGSGKGGRNQEFALAAASRLDGVAGVHLRSVGTDGIDGPTDAAGGWVDGGTMAKARRRGVDLDEALRKHSAYDALRRLGQLLVTGPTGTNVMDLHVMLAEVRRPAGTAGSSRRGGAPASRRRRS